MTRFARLRLWLRRLFLPWAESPLGRGKASPGGTFIAWAGDSAVPELRRCRCGVYFRSAGKRLVCCQCRGSKPRPSAVLPFRRKRLP